jgi:DNA repair exonuclease SbcCD nuclease subunit
MILKFIHTSDWQLGKPNINLGAESRSRYLDAQFECLRLLREQVDALNVQLLLVTGDIFDHYVPQKHIVNKTLEQINKFSIPIFLLPGNHDYVNPSTIWTNPEFIDKLSGNITVVNKTEPYPVEELGIEIIGFPWTSKDPAKFDISSTINNLGESKYCRFVLAHGQIENRFGSQSNSKLRMSDLQNAVDELGVCYIALGDRHSTTYLNPDKNICYSGAIQATDYDEEDPNNVLVVEIDTGNKRILSNEKLKIGKWEFIKKAAELTSSTSVEQLLSEINAVENKERTVLQLDLTGIFDIESDQKLRESLSNFSDLYAFLKCNDENLEVYEDENSHFVDTLNGSAKSAFLELRQLSKNDPSDVKAKDALRLFYQLAKEAQ